MKETILFLLLNSLVLWGQAQQMAFPSELAIWKYVIEGDTGPTPNTLRYTLTGDTLIGANNYQFINDDYIRTVANKVYFLPKDSMTEFLIYDFDLELGDQFINQWSYFPDDPDTIVVDQIDSILTNEGYLKRWYFGPSGGQWIEGIGSPFSPTQPAYQASLSGGFSLLCFQNEQTLVYERALSILVNGMEVLLNCDDLVSTAPIPQENDQQWVMAPNPFRDQLDIVGTSLLTTNTLHIYQLDGRLLHTFYDRKTIHLPDLLPGVYLLVMEIEQQRYTAQIVKL
ncbi:MAG: T9SS type A sorting domain-containing protein [Bacteroidota bacterium]